MRHKVFHILQFHSCFIEAQSTQWIPERRLCSFWRRAVMLTICYFVWFENFFVPWGQSRWKCEQDLKRLIKIVQKCLNHLIQMLYLLLSAHSPILLETWKGSFFFSMFPYFMDWNVTDSHQGMVVYITSTPPPFFFSLLSLMAIHNWRR